MGSVRQRRARCHRQLSAVYALVVPRARVSDARRARPRQSGAGAGRTLAGAPRPRRERCRLCALCAAILWSPLHRARHDQALRIDYPRIPEPRSTAEFETWRSAGTQLVDVLCAPLPAAPTAEHVPRRAQPIEIDRARCEVRLGGARVCSISPAALEVRIGHHLPLIDRLRAGPAHAMFPERLRALCARLDALAALSAALPVPPA